MFVVKRLLYTCLGVLLCSLLLIPEFNRLLDVMTFRIVDVADKMYMVGCLQDRPKYKQTCLEKKTEILRPYKKMWER